MFACLECPAPPILLAGWPLYPVYGRRPLLVVTTKTYVIVIVLLMTKTSVIVIDIAMKKTFVFVIDIVMKKKFAFLIEKDKKIQVL